MSNGKSGKATYDTVGTWVANSDATQAATLEMAPGTAFWYGAKNYATPFTVTVAGGVITDVSKTIVINKQYTHIANPYPVALNLNESIGYVSGMTKGQSGAADEIQIQNATGGYVTYYMSNGKSGKATYDTDAKWVANSDATQAANVSIPVGKGAWYVRRGSTDFNLVITKPYDL